MSSNTPTVTTTDELQRQLADLVSEARRNEVAVKGSWPCDDGADARRHEALITEVTQPPD